MSSEPNVRAEFFTHAVLLPAQSRDAGRPMYVDRDYVRISVVGSKDVFEAPANEQHKERFPVEWDAYQRKQARPLSGTPITEWPAISPAQVRNLQSYNVMTVEDMANASDAALQKIGMGARELQQRARAFLEGATGGRAKELEAQVSTQAETIKAQEETIKQQNSLLTQLEQRIAAIEAGTRAEPAKPGKREAAAA